MNLLFPPLRLYAVIQMDPVAMVKHLDDPVALKEARALRPQKYLVYLIDVRLPSSVVYDVDEPF